MNFTREPIIETIITPKEGHKLVIRNTKAAASEEYIVDAIEVVSFGKTHFFRSTERPKPFLVPVSDYEVVEAKETRVVLKNATFERQIKIGGGKSSKDKQEAEPAEVEERLDKKRERRRHRRRRTPGEIGETGASGEEASKAEGVAKEAKPAEGGGGDDETLVSSSVVRRHIPAPTTLISQTLSQEKAADAAPVEGDVLPEPKVTPEAEEKPKRGRRKKVAEEKLPEETPNPEEKTPVEESGDMNRVAAEPVETATSTSFSSIEKEEKTSFFGKIW